MPLPSRGNSIAYCLTKWLPFKQRVDGCLNLQEVTALWQFTSHSDGNLDVVVLQLLQSEDGMNNFVTEAASVIKGRVAQEDQALHKRLSRD
jgi:hypothetical protein